VLLKRRQDDDEIVPYDRFDVIIGTKERTIRLRGRAAGTAMVDCNNGSLASLNMMSGVDAVVLTRSDAKQDETTDRIMDVFY